MHVGQSPRASAKPTSHRRSPFDRRDFQGTCRQSESETVATCEYDSPDRHGLSTKEHRIDHALCAGDKYLPAVML